MKQIKMFYISSKVEEDEGKVNEFLKEKGEWVIDVQMNSNSYPGGDTIDTIMVVYKEVEN